MNISKLTKRSLVLGSASAVAIAMAGSAQAATSTTPTNLVYSSAGGRCFINATFAITGTTADNPSNTDEFQVRVTDGNVDARLDMGSSDLIGVGNTASRTLSASIRGITADDARFSPLYYSVIDNIPTATGTQYVTIAQTPLDPAAMRAAGGECAAAANAIPNTTNAAPSAAASGGSVVEGNSFTLDASGSSDPENQALTYSWQQVSGPAVTLSDPTVVMPSFTAPASNVRTDLVFELTVIDPFGASDVTTATVTVVPANNTAPVAAVATTTISATGGQSLTLDGSPSSDPQLDPISYDWVQTGGTSVTLSASNQAVASFQAPAKTNSAQVLTFELTVTDPAGLQDTQSVTVTVAANVAPASDAGADQTVSQGSQASLDGSGSNDPDGDALTYSWAQVSGTSVTIAQPAAAQTTFGAPAGITVDETLVFELTVTDALGASSTDQVEFLVLANSAPVADAGMDRTVAGLTSVILDATNSSDVDGDPLSYSFTQLSGTSVTLTDNGDGTASFIAPIGTANAQVLEFEVTVDDGNSQATDVVTITVEPNTAPIADAGSDQGPIDSGTSVQLNGNGSSDPEGDALTYSWTQVSGTSVTLTGANTATPSFSAPLVAGTEDLVFQLVVNDGQVDSAPDTVRIAIRAQGTITIVQRVVGDDTTVAYTTNVPGLASTITTSGGQGSASVSQVTAGSYSFSVDDLRAQGYALTALDCNDTDSAVSLANASIGIELSPSEDLVCTVELSDTRSAATQAISEFLGGRNALLMGAEPSRQRRIDRLRGKAPQGGQATVGGMPVPGSDKLPMQVGIDGDKAVVRGSLAMTRGALGMGGAAEGKFDIWFEGQMADVTLGRNKGTFKAGFIGADYVVSENLLVGALFQIDDFDNDDETLGVGEAQGSGWMAGPYITARFDEQFYVDARIAYGKSSNSVSPLGTFVSDFDTTRLFATLSASGDVALGEGFTLWPEASLRYLREGVEGYTDALGVRIDDFNVDQGEVAFSPRIDYLSESADGWTTAPYAKMEGVLTFGANAFSPVDNGLRGKTAVGIDVRSPDDVRFGLSGFYDGIGEDDYKALGGTVTVGFSF